MIPTHLQVKIAIGKILASKREKNRILMNEQKQPRFILIATHEEIQKQLEVVPEASVPSLELDPVLLEMVRSRELVPFAKGFTLPSVVKAEAGAVEKNWSK